MSETALRQALGAAITVSIIGIVALTAGGFFAPIPTDPTDGSFIVTAYLVRSILVIIGLAISLIVTYFVGLRIVNAESSDDSADSELPKPDPSASSPIITLLNTPGARRDALFGGGIVMFAYWFITTLYIIAFGKFLGNAPITPDNAASTIFQHLVVGVVFVAAGLGLGGLGARTALARKMTNFALSAPTFVVARPQSATTVPDVIAEPPSAVAASDSSDSSDSMPASTSTESAPTDTAQASQE